MVGIRCGIVIALLSGDPDQPPGRVRVSGGDKCDAGNVHLHVAEQHGVAALHVNRAELTGKGVIRLTNGVDRFGVRMLRKAEDAAK